MEHPGNEKRKSTRMSVEIAARLRFGEREIAFPALRTCDISAEGLGLILSTDIDGASTVLDSWQEAVEVELDLPDGNWLKLPAKIAWRRSEDGSGELRMGLEFGAIGVSEKKALKAYIQ